MATVALSWCFVFLDFRSFNMSSPSRLLKVGLGRMCSLTKNFQLCLWHCLHVFRIMLVKIGNYAQKMLITVQINTFYLHHNIPN